MNSLFRAGFLLVVTLFLLAACGGSSGSDDQGGFTIQDGDEVDVHYDGTLDDGTTFDSSRDRATPFTFVAGAGEVIDGFDAAVLGLKVGDTVTVRIEPADAYGERSEDAVVEVSIGDGQEDVTVGDEVFLNTGQSAVVIEVTAETVTLDINHRLAGEALTFDIEVLAITRPTEG